MYRVLLSSNYLKLTFPVYQVLSFLRFSTGSSKDFPLELDPSTSSSFGCCLAPHDDGSDKTDKSAEDL